MNNPVPALLDRLAHRLESYGVKLKRNQLLELTAVAFGIRNSNELAAAGKQGALRALAAAAPIGRFALADGTTLAVLKDSLAGTPYAIDASFLEQTVAEERRERIGVTPYGHLIDLDPLIDAELSDIQARSGQLPAGEVALTRATVERLIRAAQTLTPDVVGEEAADLTDAIAAANTRLDAAPAQSAATIERSDDGSITVYHGTISHKHGSDTCIAVTQAELYRQLAGYCHENWHEVAAYPEVPTDPQFLSDFEVVDTYFEAMSNHDGREYLDLSEVALALPAGMALMASAEAQGITSSFLAKSPADWPIQIAEALESGASADIWYDAHDFGGNAENDPDRQAENTIEQTQQAMQEAARILRGIVPENTCHNKATKERASSDNELVFLTSHELELVGSEDLPELCRPHLGTDKVLNDDDLPVALGRAARWKGEYWYVADVVFGWGEAHSGNDAPGINTRESALGRAHRYADYVRSDVEALGGLLQTEEEAADFAHVVEILLPASLAHQAEDAEDWFSALSYLLASAEQREKTQQVTAEFTAQAWFRDCVYSVDAEGDTVWDATFDARLGGRKNAQRALATDADDYRSSPLAPKWIRDWSGPFDVQLIGLEELFKLEQ